MSRLFCIIWLVCFISTAWGQCDGLYRGKRLTVKQLREILSLPLEKKPDLCGADLSRMDLNGLSFHQINLSESNLSFADLSGSDFSRATLKSTNLESTTLKNTYFSWANLEGSDFSNAKGEAVIFQDANLQHSRFDSARLPKANFSHAQLERASLERLYAPESNWSFSKAPFAIFLAANLQSADFEQASLPNADMTFVQANRVSFKNANLMNTRLIESSLIQSDFTGGNLSQSQLDQANMQHAKLLNSNIFNAQFTGANFFQLFYQPQLGKLPDIVSIANTKHFETIRFSGNTLQTPGLNELRLAYRKAGMRRMEKLITSLVKTTQMREMYAEGGLNAAFASASYVLFYLTCGFGLQSAKPLMIFLAFILLFSLPYRYAMSQPSTKSRLLVRWQSRNLLGKHNTRDDFMHSKIIKSYAYSTTAKKLSEQLRLWRCAIYFSLLSAFHIGWDDFNIAKWIREMQPRPYILTAEGYLRLLSGLQSIISAYLVVLWALTYFGSPFEW